MNVNPLYPGRIIGIIGDNITNMALCLQAKEMGFEIAFYSQLVDSNTMKLADYKYVAPLSDSKTLLEFARKCDLVIYNSDEVTAEMVDYLSRETYVPQGANILELIQDRLIARSFFEMANINMVPYATITNLEDIYKSITSLGYPVVLKPIQKATAASKEIWINNRSDIVKGAGVLQTGPYILESYIEHEVDYAVIVTKAVAGNYEIMPTIEVIYQEQQVKTAFSNPVIKKSVAAEIKRIASQISDYLNYVGTFEISLFTTDNDTIYVDRITPMLSNAGEVFRYSLNTTQYEQHLRAIANVPLTEPLQSLPTIFQAIQRKDYLRVQTQWAIKNNWHFTFYGINGRKDTDLLGHILIPTSSITDTLIQMESTNLWREIDFKSKYEKFKGRRS